MPYYKLLIINGMGTKYLNLSTQMVVEPKIEYMKAQNAVKSLHISSSITKLCTTNSYTHYIFTAVIIELVAKRCSD